VQRAIDTFVFLTPRAINDYEENKWSFEYLRSEGFSVKVININKILDRTCKSSLAVIKPLQGDYIYDVESCNQLELLIKNLSANAIFIDYLVCHNDVTLDFEGVFRLLKKYNSKYIVVSSGVLPLPRSISKYGLHRIVQLFKKICIILKQPKKIIEYLGKRIILALTKRGIIYPLPFLIFGGNSEIMRRFIHKRNLDMSCVIGIHSYDYDESIRHKRNNLNIVVQKDICVFLDEAATHHTDFLLGDDQPPDQDVYFEAINNLFDAVEKNTGLKVVVAAHPRSDYGSLGDVFKGREVVKDNTMGLVASSQLVIMHASTSVSYAVLNNKPVLLSKVPGLPKDHPINIMVDVFSRELDLKVINILEDDLQPSIFRGNVNTQKYLNYKNSYIKNVGALELPEWEIVVGAVKKFNQSR
jgi:hypothetical protein